MRNMATRFENVNTTPPTVKKRRRPALACAQCRRRKIRCDQNTPCNNCVRSGIPDCTIPPNHISTLRLQQSRVAAPRPATTISPPSAVASTTLTPRPTPQSVYTEESNVDELQSKIKELENTISSLKRDNADQQRSAPGDAPVDGPPAGARFGNQSAWLNNTTLYTKVLNTLKDLRDQRPELKESLTSCQTLLGQVNDQLIADTTIPISSLGTHMPNKAVTDELLDLYLRSFEGLFRIVHVPSFLAEYQSYWQQPTEARKVFVLQLQICLGLGSRAHPDAIQYRRVASQWLTEAETWLGTAFRKSQRKQMSFEDLQLMCLALIMEADSSGSEKSNWISAGDLLRMAMCLNLHRDPKQLGTTSPQQAELRRRLWATILELNLLFSLQAGQTPLISPNDYDTLPPASLSDEELDQDVPGGRIADEQRITPTTIQLALFESFELRLRIVRRINGTGSGCTYDEVIRHHKELSKAEARMHHKLSPAAVTGLSTNSGAQKSLAQTILSYYLLALHLPVLGQYIKDPTRHFSRKVATTVANKILESCLIADPDHRSQPRTRGSQHEAHIMNRLLINSPGFLRQIAVQAVFYLALEYVTMKEDQAEDIGAFMMREEMELQSLLIRAQAWIVDRVRRGMKDVYTCCFIAASISYAKTLGSSEASSSRIEDGIAEKALEQSEECQRALEDLAQSLGAVDNEPAPVPDTSMGFPNHDLSSAEIPMDWMANMVMDGSNYYDWSFQGGPGNMPHILL